MRKATATVALAAALAAPAAAHAQEPPRLAQYDDVFSSRLPGTPTARHAETDIVNPGDPNGKPVAISHVHVQLAPGTVVNTDAVPQCTASDAEIVGRGPAACPADTVVGSGLIDVDTGFPGGNRHVVSDVVFANARDQLVFITTQRGSGTHLPIRGQYSRGNLLDIDVPPVPGTPPDGGADTHEVIDLMNRSSTRGGRRVAYMTTPPACPAGGRWTNRLTYTFRDGVVQTFTAQTPCRRAAARPRIRVGHLPRRCARRSFKVRVAISGVPELRSADLLLDGHRFRRTPQYLFRARVPVRRLRGGRHTLTVLARSAHGTAAARSVRFRRC
jgi:hypothetical protein